jgi:hypothetical protein
MGSEANTHTRKDRLMSRIDRGPASAPCAFTVDEFCEIHRVSRSWLYNEWRAGRGPKVKQIGVKKIITVEAAAQWRASDA